MVDLDLSLDGLILHQSEQVALGAEVAESATLSKSAECSETWALAGIPPRPSPGATLPSAGLGHG